MRASGLALIFLFAGAELTYGAGPSLTYHGRLVDPNEHAVVATSVQFRLQIRTPGSEDCLLYEETQTKDLSQTDGIFSITLNDGTGTRQDSSGYSMDQVFANRKSYTFAGGQCASGTTWTPAATDGRKMQVSFNDGILAAGTWEQVPSMAINFIPLAVEAMQVGGYKKEQLLKIADGVSTTGTELNNTSWTELLALLSGTTTQYVKSGSANFTAAPQWNGVPSGANDLVNKTYVDAQVAAGLPNVGTAGTYTKVTTDAKGRVTSGAALVEADLPTLTTAGKVSGNALNVGTIAGSTAINSTGNIVTTGTVQGATVSATSLRAYNGANYVQLAAPGLGSNLNLSLPSVDGAAGTLMKTNGAGQLSFAALSAADIPSLDAAKVTTGTLPIARGGTGLTSYGNNSVLVSNGTGSAINSLNCTIGQVIKFDVSGYAGCGADSTGVASQWTTTGSDIYYSTGNVGIGTASPGHNLEVNGNFRAGQIFINTGLPWPNMAVEHTDGSSYSGRLNVASANGGDTQGAIHASVSGVPLNMNRYGLIINSINGVADVSGNYLGGIGFSGTGAPGATATQLLTASIIPAVDGAVNSTTLPTALTFNTSTTKNSGLTERMRISSAGNIGVGTTSPAAKLQIAGEAIVGESGLTCSVTTKGAIRYNNTTNVLEFCNGTGWNLIQAAACSDYAPNSFTFTDQANLTTSTLTTSDIVQISGINCSVPVSISGTGSPQYRTCSDSGCSTVVQDWTAGPSSMTSGQYLQLRQTTDAAGGVGIQANVIVGSGMTIWTAGTLGGCSGSQAIGTVCADGTVYAGISSDAGGVQMFTQRCDIGQTWNGTTCAGSRLGLTWNNGTTNLFLLGYISSVTGKSNSAGIFASADAGSPYYAAKTCEDLNEGGHTDWYLPAHSELSVLYTNKATIRYFDTSGAYYWSSSEAAFDNAWVIRLSDGATASSGSGYKRFTNWIRCVRR